MNPIRELKKIAMSLERTADYFPGEERKDQFDLPDKVTYTFRSESDVDEAIEILTDDFWSDKVTFKKKDGNRLVVMTKAGIDDATKVELDFTMHNLFAAQGSLAPE